jgi:hypothetical protein
MQQALTTPVLRSVVVGGVLLGLGVFGAIRSECREPITRRLVLHACERPNTVYLSAWRDGDLLVTFEGAELQPITFNIRARVFDSCLVQGTETLTPINDRTYHYEYSETILSCDPGGVPVYTTPRTGTVVVANP